MTPMPPVRRPASDYASLAALGRVVVGLEHDQVNLKDQVVEQGRRTDHNVADLEQKIDDLAEKLEDKFGEVTRALELLGREILGRAKFEDGAKAVLKLGWKGICCIAGGLVSLIAAGVGGLAYYAPHIFTN
jgi:hypothetical protein